LSEARQAGIQRIELGNKFPRDASVLGPILKQHDLFSCTAVYQRQFARERSVEDEIAAMQNHLNLAQSR